MLAREEIKFLQNIVDDILENKESEPFRQPVDYKSMIFNEDLLNSFSQI